jgi:hypothetical protein
MSHIRKSFIPITEMRCSGPCGSRAHNAERSSMASEGEAIEPTTLVNLLIEQIWLLRRTPGFHSLGINL